MIATPSSKSLVAQLRHHVRSTPHQAADKDVALKTLNLEHAEITNSRRPEFFSRFKKEARSLTQLRHGSIINVMDFGIVGDATPFLVMDYFPGEPLLSGERQRPDDEPVARRLRQIFEALGHAHNINVVHRDIESANVLVDGTAAAPKVMLIDWGIAYSIGGTRISLGGVVGTTGAIDPENYCDPAAEYVPESDFYAVGGMLYDAMCGREPFATSVDMTEAQRRAVIMANDIVAPSVLVPDIPMALEDFLLSLLATERKHRPPCAAACIEVIDAIIRGEDLVLDDIFTKHREAANPRPFIEAAPAVNVEDEKRRVAAMIAEFEVAKSRPSSVKRLDVPAPLSAELSGPKTVSLHSSVMNAIDDAGLPPAPPEARASAAEGPDQAAARYGYKTDTPEKPWRKYRRHVLATLVVMGVSAVFLSRSAPKPSTSAQEALPPTVLEPGALSRRRTRAR